MNPFAWTEYLVAAFLYDACAQYNTFSGDAKYAREHRALCWVMGVDPEEARRALLRRLLPVGQHLLGDCPDWRRCPQHGDGQ